MDETFVKRTTPREMAETLEVLANRGAIVQLLITFPDEVYEEPTKSARTKLERREFPSMRECLNEDGTFTFPELLYERINASFWAGFYNHLPVPTDICRIFASVGRQIKRYPSDAYDINGRQVLYTLPWRTGQSGAGCVKEILKTYEVGGEALLRRVLANFKPADVDYEDVDHEDVDHEARENAETIDRKSWTKAHKACLF